MSEIAEKVKMIVKDKLNIDDDSKITEDATFVNDLGADSLDTVDLIMELENTFGIEIPEDQSEKIKTVGDAIAYIEEAQK